jgi:hypothetical protein
MFPERKQSCTAANESRKVRTGDARGFDAGGRETMTDLDQRIETMFQGDRRGAWILVAVLWIAVIFVLSMSWPYIPDSGVKTVVLLAAAAVLIFNTAAVFAMIKHYEEDKEFIYGLDIKHLDAAKERRD